MQNEEINVAVIEYQQTWSQELFAQLYQYFCLDWKRSVKWDAQYAGVDVDDILSHYGLTLYQVAMRYDPSKGNFANMLARSLANTKKSLRRANMKRNIHECTARTEEEAATFLDVADQQVDFIFEEKKKEQRQLLSCLVAEIDNITHLIITHYLEGNSYNAVGKRLGIENKLVKRRIEKLSRRYDCNRFGDYQDYLYA